MLLKTFGWSAAITIAGLVGGFLIGGPSGLAIVAILIVLEVSLSFDNAVVNATILKRMNAFWQKIFLTVGILIAVFGMRLVFPLLIVCLTGHVGPIEAIDLAIKGGDQETPGTYAHMLHDAHPSIAAFGGMFLLMLFLDFVFEKRDLQWLRPIERPLAKIGKLDQLSVVVALLVLAVVSQTLAKEPGTVLFSGILGLSIVPDELPARTHPLNATAPSRSLPVMSTTPERTARIVFTILMTPAAASRPADPKAATWKMPDCTDGGSSPKADTSLSTFWIRPRIGPFAPSPAPMRTFSKSPFSFSRSPFALLSFAAATCAATPDSDTLLM